jgi:hypothetical protein
VNDQVVLNDNDDDEGADEDAAATSLNEVKKRTLRISPPRALRETLPCLPSFQE